MTTTDHVMRQWLAQALSRCCEGRLSADDIMAADCSFLAMGVDSIAMVRLVDAVECEFDVILDGRFPEDLDALAALLELETSGAGHG
ncbi:acyl carrier protein [Nonomuraea sp. NPDC050663]|uniref:acyl carrier protein n=1 Tax=Nonomuraea sp. NPDC050663 TaxID=3364370 RepID=UPI0037969580